MAASIHSRVERVRQGVWCAWVPCMNVLSNRCNLPPPPPNRMGPACPVIRRLAHMPAQTSGGSLTCLPRHQAARSHACPDIRRLAHMPAQTSGSSLTCLPRHQAARSHACPVIRRLAHMPAQTSGSSVTCLPACMHTTGCRVSPACHKGRWCAMAISSAKKTTPCWPGLYPMSTHSTTVLRSKHYLLLEAMHELGMP